MATQESTDFAGMKFTGIPNEGLGYYIEVEVHNGTPPTSIDGWTPSAHSATRLIQFSNCPTSMTTHAGGRKLQLQNTVAATATQTGTATWAVLYNPSTWANAIMVEPTLNGGNGCVLLPTLNIVSGNNVDLIDINISMYYS